MRVSTVCEHDDVQSERAIEVRPWGEYPVGVIGTCLDCGAAMTLDGDEDGHPTWVAAESWTAEELLTIANQSGLGVERA